MIIYPLKSRVVRPGDSVFEHLVESLRQHKLTLRAGDILAVSSKVVSLSERRLRRLGLARVSKRARRLARLYSLPPALVQVILEESDLVIGGVTGALLTIVNDDATVNAGVDRKNAPPDHAILWPENPDRSARDLNRKLRAKSGRNVGVVIVDSRVTPLRLGTIGLAIGCSGLRPLKDFRGKIDLEGRPVEITLQAVADGIAAAAQVVMGEAAERVPFVLVRNAPVEWSSRSGIREAKLVPEKCVYMSQVGLLK